MPYSTRRQTGSPLGLPSSLFPSCPYPYLSLCSCRVTVPPSGSCCCLFSRQLFFSSFFIMKRKLICNFMMISKQQLDRGEVGGGATRMNMFSFFTCRRSFIFICFFFCCFSSRICVLLCAAFPFPLCVGRRPTPRCSPPLALPSSPFLLPLYSLFLSLCPSASAETCCYFETCLPTQLSSLLPSLSPLFFP